MTVIFVRIEWSNREGCTCGKWPTLEYSKELSCLAWETSKNRYTFFFSGTYNGREELVVLVYIEIWVYAFVCGLFNGIFNTPKVCSIKW